MLIGYLFKVFCSHYEELREVEQLQLPWEYFFSRSRTAAATFGLFLLAVKGPFSKQENQEEILADSAEQEQSKSR